MPDNDNSAPASRAPKSDSEPKRYAAYDTTYLRFVDGVYDSKDKAAKAAKAAKVEKFEIREV